VKGGYLIVYHVQKEVTVRVMHHHVYSVNKDVLLTFLDSLFVSIVLLDDMLPLMEVGIVYSVRLDIIRIKVDRVSVSYVLWDDIWMP